MTFLKAEQFVADSRKVENVMKTNMIVEKKKLIIGTNSSQEDVNFSRQKTVQKCVGCLQI